MAIFHLSTKPISRSSGRSSTASAAYRSACRITDKRTGRIHDYTKKSGVLYSEVMDKNGLSLDRTELWNLAEAAENRKDGRTAREWVVAIPRELVDEIRNNKNEITHYDVSQGSTAVKTFARHLAKTYNVAVDFAIHAPDKEGDNRNYHAHIMTTTRELSRTNEGIALGDKTPLEWSNTKRKDKDLQTTGSEIKDIRKEWATIANRFLEGNGNTQRLDHRSNAERGLLFKPTIKLGWQASQLERLGIETTEGDINRQIADDNMFLSVLDGELKDLEKQLAEQQAEEKLTEQQALRVEPKPPTPLPVIPEAKPKLKKVEVKNIALDKYTQESFEKLHHYHNEIIVAIDNGDSLLAVKILSKKFLENVGYIGTEANSLLYDRGLDSKRLEDIDEVISTSKELLENVSSMLDEQGLGGSRDIVMLQEKAVSSLDSVAAEAEKVQARSATPSQQQQPLRQNTPSPR